MLGYDLCIYILHFSLQMSELDILAAQMNAAFEEAECFELVVE